MELLPAELMVYLCSILDGESVLRLNGTAKGIKSFTDEPLIWKLKCMELGWPLQEVEKDICNWKGIWLNTKKNKQYNTLSLTIKTNNKVLVEYSPSKRQFQILDQEYITKRDIIQFVHACTTQDFISEKKLTLRMDLLLSSFNKRDLCLILKEVLGNMGVTFPVEKGKWRVDQQRQQLYIWFEAWRKSKARKYNIQQLK